MAACPPGTILNPRTYRCVTGAGRVARRLAAAGEIAEAEVGYAAALAPYYAPVRRTRRAPRQEAPVPLASYYAPAKPAPLAPYYAPAKPSPYYAPVPPKPVLLAPPPPLVSCGPGQQRNPQTGRCIRVGGRTYKRIQAPVPPAPAPPAPRRATSDAPLPVGTATTVPLADRKTMADWANTNCINSRDPITGRDFKTLDSTALQELIRLHNRTCALATGLNDRVYAQHMAGQVATLPDGSAHMTLDDFTALRAAMRRRNPAYKIPGRKHRPPPANWQLYVSSDSRSGPDFASVMYIDVTKARRTASGSSIEFPTEAVMVDLGFIPTAVLPGGLCSMNTIVNALKALDESHRLLTPVAGGWKPVSGFPFSKRYWGANDRIRQERVSRLCRELVNIQARPF